jgi:hypothetical protein
MLPCAKIDAAIYVPGCNFAGNFLGNCEYRIGGIPYFVYVLTKLYGYLVGESLDI